MDSVFEGENGFHAGLGRALDGALGVGNPEGWWREGKAGRERLGGGAANGLPGVMGWFKGPIAGNRPDNHQPTTNMFSRLGRLIKGFFGLFVGGLERKNPEALLDLEKENLRKQIGEYNKGLTGHAALVERLISRVRSLEAEEKDLHAKVLANLRAGNKEAAAQFALRHQQAKTEHVAVRGQLEESERTYKELVTARDVSVKAAREKIEKVARGINEAKVAKATAELNQMAAGMVTEIGAAGETLGRLEEIVREEKEKAAGVARVARDSIDMTGIAMKAGEQKALEDLALADFAAMEGIAIEGASAAGSTGGEAPSKTMSGPQATAE